MTISARISRLLVDLMEAGPYTQRELAAKLGVSQPTLRQYIEGVSVPGIEVLDNLATLLGWTIDKLVRDATPLSEEERGRIHIQATALAMGHKSIAAGRDVYVNTRVHRTHEYIPQPGDITADQASRLKTLVDQIVELEKATRTYPKGYGAVWNALNRHCRVTYYREIKADQFSDAELYLVGWIGRLKRGAKRTAPGLHRKARYAAIFARGKEFGLSHDQIDDLIWARYGVGSLSDLKPKQLDQFYNYIMGLGRTR